MNAHQLRPQPIRTVGQLKALLANMPDDAAISVPTHVLAFQEPGIYPLLIAAGTCNPAALELHVCRDPAHGNTLNDPAHPMVHEHCITQGQGIPIHGSYLFPPQDLETHRHTFVARDPNGADLKTTGA